MFLKSRIENEQFYWDKQIERHQIAKRVRNMARKIDEKPYKQLAKDLGISSKTIWALANGLATASEKLMKKISELENEIKL